MSDDMTAAEQRLQNQLCFAVHSASHAFQQAYKRHLEPYGLTYPQYLVLLMLWEQDGLSVKELGAPLFLDSGTLTPLLKRMEKAGWLERRRDAKDERIVRVTLTESGRELRNKLSHVPGAMLCATGLDRETLVSLRDEVNMIGARLRSETAKA